MEKISFTSGRLPRHEIKEMIKEAEKYEAEDEEHLKKADARKEFEIYLDETRGTRKNKRVKSWADENIEDAIQWLVEMDELAERVS